MSKQKKWIAIGVLIICLFAFGKYNESKKEKSKALEPKEVVEIETPKNFKERFNEKHYNEISGVYKPIRNYLRKNLNDPSSLEVVNTWNLGMNKDSTFATKTTFRAKNSFNALVMQAIYCNIDYDGNLSEVRVE